MGLLSVLMRALLRGAVMENSHSSQIPVPVENGKRKIR
jgi:hypothetical protein